MALRELVWKIGGEQGTGLDSTSDVFATVCNRLGYYIYAYKTFSSRIKGGHTNFTVRVSTRRVLATAAGVHVLVAMDQDSIDRLAGELVPGGLLIADSHFQPRAPEGVQMVTVPMTEIARDLLNPVYRNIAAIGASAALLGLPLQAFKDYLAEKFAAKGEQVVQGNWTALERGYSYTLEQAADKAFQLDPGDGQRRLIMTGNDAIALGAVAAGCRLVVAYPITPASEILENCARILPRFGGAAVQVEDELAAVAVCIGAGFAGARAMTATAGPGISLMQENIGLASMAEIPVVIVDVQRGGPSTGMPTKHEQSDLLALAYGGHGEGPRIVLAPGTAEQAFYDTVLAFNLADNYHCPVIIASDLGLGLWQQTVDSLDFDRVVIDRGPVVDPKELEAMGRDVFQRYAFTESGVSPRSLPGMKYGQYLATGVEHATDGKVKEDPANRTRMMQKRLNKIKKLEIGGQPVPGILYEGPARPEILLISYGSTFGVVAEAAELLREQGHRVATLQVRVIRPLPVEELRAAIGAAEKTFVVENNATGQLAFIMRAEGVEHPVESILKYDGTLFRPDEVAAAVLESYKGVPA
nr:MAG: 2-oxoacid:acceptor oxidoreductase subunit alpha [Bacillota bacterium]